MSTTQHPGASAARPSKLLLPFLLITVFVMPISISGVSVALSDIAEELGNSPTPLQWVINGFNVFAAVFMLVWGVASDRIGYKATFILGQVIMVGANVLSAAAPDLGLLDLGRVLAGIGGAAIFAGGAALLSHAYAGAARGRAFALFGMTVGLGLALGPTISGFLTQAFTWRGVFLAFAIVTFLGLLGAGVFPNAHAERISGQKLVDFGLLRNSRYLSFALVPVAQAVGYVTVLTYLPVAFSAELGLSSSAVGLLMLLATVPVFFGPIISAQLMARVKRISPLSMINVAIGAMVLGDLGLLWLAPGASLGLLIVPMLVLGLGYGLPIGFVDAEALSTVSPRSAGTAAGVLNFLRLGSEAVVVGVYAIILTGVLGVLIGSPTITAQTAAGVPGHGDDYAAAMHWIVVGLAIVTAVVGIAINILHAVKTTGVPDVESVDESSAFTPADDQRA